MYSHFPGNQRELMLFLEKLGFRQKKRIGKGRHQYKYFHPERVFMCDDRKNFIIVPHYIYKQMVLKIIKRLVCWGFSEEELKDCL